MFLFQKVCSTLEPFFLFFFEYIYITLENFSLLNIKTTRVSIVLFTRLIYTRFEYEVLDKYVYIYFKFKNEKEYNYIRVVYKRWLVHTVYYYWTTVYFSFVYDNLSITIYFDIIKWHIIINGRIWHSLIDIP